MFTDKLTRKQEIHQTAARLFNEMGFNAVSMRDLAAELDIKASSLYNHIASKDEILTDIILNIGNQFTAGMEAIVDKEKDIILQLEELISLHVHIVVGNPNAIGCLNNDWKHLNPESKEVLMKMRKDYEEQFRQIIRRGIAESKIVNLNLEVILFSLLSTLRTMNIWYSKKGSDNVEELTKQVIIILLGGIKTK